jgi:hypothetical protein
MDVKIITMPIPQARAAFKEYRAAVRGDQKKSAWFCTCRSCIRARNSRLARVATCDARQTGPAARMPSIAWSGSSITAQFLPGIK